MLRTCLTMSIASVIFFAQSAGAQLTEQEIAEMAATARAELQEKGFDFSFPDLEGKIVTKDDPKFKGKVLLVDLWGTWCLPCRREAPFLVGLYEKYRSEGLEIVGIAFEFGDDKEKHIERIGKFLEKNKSVHTALYGGKVDDAKDKMFLSVARLGYPTVILVGRDGAVREVEAGFWDSTAKNIESTVKELLQEKTD